MHHIKLYLLEVNFTSSVIFNFAEGLYNDPFLQGTFKL